MANDEAEEHFDIAKRVIRNSSFVFIGNFVSNVLSFIISILIARYLGDAFFGNYSFVFSYIPVFLVLSHMGIDTVMVRELSKGIEKRNKLLSSAFMLKTILSLASAILSVALIFILPYSSNVRLGVAFASLFLIFCSYVMTFSSIFQAKLDMLAVSVSLIISKIVMLGLVFTVMTWYKGGFVMMIIATSIPLAVQAMILLYSSRRYYSLRLALYKKEVAYLLRESWPFALSNLVIIIYLRADVFMLSLMGTSASIGQYSAAYNLTEATTVLAVAFMTSIFPLMSSFYDKHRRRFLQIYKISFKLLISAALPLATGISLLSGRILQLVYGNDYLQGATVLPFLAFTAACIFINVYTGPVMVVMKKQKLSLVISSILLILNILLNILLIPALGNLGAGITKLTTELLGCALTIAVIFRFLKVYPFDISSAKIVAVSAIMGGFVFLTRDVLSIFLIVPIAILLYAGLYFLFGLVGKWEVQLVKRLLLGGFLKG